MKRVLIRNKRTGGTKNVREREARILVQLGRWEYAKPEPKKEPAPPPPPEPVDEDADLQDLSYNDLRRLASDMGVNPEGRKADDYIAAIEEARKPKTYGTRALNAEE
jgi:hypothetical protein